VLWLYQKYCGLKHSSVPLIAQSVDSRNHVIVAGGVGAGLFAAWFDLLLLDRLVGLAVAVLILKAAGELLRDLLASAGEEEMDLSRWGFSRLESRRHRQTVRWFLYEIDAGRITRREQMMQEARAATDFSKVASFRALGIDEQPDREQKLERAVEEVFERGLAEQAPAPGGDAQPAAAAHGAGRLVLTDAGRAELEKALAGRPALFRPAGPRPGVTSFALRFVVSVVVFAMLYLALRWVLGWLPPLEVWDGMPVVSVPGLRGAESLSLAQVVLAAAGIALFHAGRTLSHRARHIIHHATEHRGERPLFLATTGPYAKRRHPHASGLILSNVGLAVGLHSVYLLVWAGIAAAAMVLGALGEERGLAAAFGESWQRYAGAVVRRFLGPWGWAPAGLAYAAAWLGTVL
jgi:protein-S-isoprenylcysteine O-methyltransferase Ste14